MPSSYQPQRISQRRSLLLAAFVATVMGVLISQHKKDDETGNHTAITQELGEPILGTMAGG
jgi:hypothetical protein